MWRLPLSDEHVILFEPRWASLGSLWQTSLLAALFVVPLVLVLLLYRSELRLVRGAVAAGLLTIRLTLIFSIWSLVCLRPLIAREYSEQAPSRVDVFVDRSGSTQVRDTGRTTLQKLCLARVLGLTNDPQTQQLVDGWIEQYGAGASTPKWAAEREAMNSERRTALEKKRKVLHDDLCQQVDRLSRADIAQKLIAKGGFDFLGRLGDKHQVELRGFDSKVSPRSAPQQLFRENASAVVSTDLSSPLSKALQDTAELTAVVVLSDGRHNARSTPIAVAKALGRRKVPVYALSLAPSKRSADVALVRAVAPATVLEDAEVTVTAKLHLSGVSAQQLKVELVRKTEPEKIAAKTILSHDGRDGAQEVHLNTTLKEAGTHVFELRVGSIPGELSVDNNRFPVVVRVVKRKTKILLVDGEARWEYHFLAKALTRDKGLEVDQVLFVQPRLGEIPKDKLKHLDLPRLKLPGKPKDSRKTDPLLDYECIFLGDVSPDDLTLEARKRLERYVSKRGGTLVVLAGKRHMPLDYVNKDDPIATMLPVDGVRAVKRDEGFPLSMTREGSTIPFLRLDPVTERNTEAWSKMPKHFWGAAGKRKPGATSLAYVAGEVEEPEERQALIAYHSYGLGTVVYVGFDSTWRWRYRKGDVYHHAFWGQLIRWATPERFLPAGNKHVRFGSESAVYRQGDEVRIKAELAGHMSILPQGAAAFASLRRQLTKGEEEVARVPLRPQQGFERMLAGATSKLPPGAYRIQLDIPVIRDKLPSGDSGKSKSLLQRPDVFQVLPRETAVVSADRQMLEELASGSGGKLFAADAAQQLVEELDERVVVTEHRDERRPWRDPPLVWWVLAVALGLLTLEWAGRKFAGLP